MPEPMSFAATIVDQSNSVGFQFQCRCLRCGTAYSSHFHALSSLAADAGGAALKKAGSLLGHQAGKVFEAVGDFVGDRAADAVKDQAKDRALQAAAQEVAPQFILCPRCRRWVCRPVCFAAAAGLCQDCALQGDTGRPPASLPSSSPQPLQTMYPRDAPPPRHMPYPGYALPSPPLPSGSAAPPSQTMNPEYAPPAQPLSSGYPPHPPLKVRIHPSRSHPGRVSLVVVDADDQVIAAMRLRPDDARALADDLLSAAEAEMRHADGPPAPTWKPTRDTRPY